MNSHEYPELTDEINFLNWLKGELIFKEEKMLMSLEKLWKDFQELFKDVEESR